MQTYAFSLQQNDQSSNSRYYTHTTKQYIKRAKIQAM